MRAVVLVGGFGTRLQPLTFNTPKQMLPVGPVTMLERVISTLGSHGVTEAVLALGYLPEVFQDAYPSGEIDGVKMHYVVEPEPLDTAGAIAFAARDVGINETFVAVNGDVLTDLDYSALIERHRATGAEGTISLTPVEDPSRFGVVPIDETGRVEAFIEKPPADEAPSNWINAGTYVLEPSFLDRVPAGRKVSIEREIFPQMVEAGSLYAMQSDVYWVDAGTPASYLMVALDLINGKRSSENPIAGSATLDPQATVIDSVVGAECTIEAGAVVERSMLGDGVTVCTGAMVTDSIVAGNAVIGIDAQVRELSVIGENETIAEGSELFGVHQPPPAPKK